MAMGTKAGKPPLLKKVKFFAQKIRLTLEENICVQKDYFRETKKIGDGADLPPKKIFFLKIRFFERPLEKTHFLEKKIWGVGASLDPQIWGPPNFWTFRHLNIV